MERLQVKDYIKGDKIEVLIKPSAPKTEITGIDGSRIKVSVSAPANKGKANIELIKFFSRILKSRVIICSGATSKRKVLKIIR